eukprot:6107545-Alexandrium_andersonii.AAC.1
MRCVQHGFSFVWPSGRCPWFALPNGQIAMLEVFEEVPYLSPGGPRRKPRQCRVKCCPLRGRGR